MVANCFLRQHIQLSRCCIRLELAIPFDGFACDRPFPEYLHFIR